MNPRPNDRYPRVASGRAAPPPTSRAVPQLAPPRPVEPPKKRSVGKVLGTIATTVLVLAVLGVIFKIIVRPVGGQPTDSVAASDSAPVPAPNEVSASAVAGPAATASPSGPSVSGVPMPTGDLPGWHQTFAEDFTGPLATKWDAYDGQPGGDSAAWFAASHVSVSGGLLTVAGYKASSPNGTLYVTGGLSNARVFSQVYGLYKVRFKVDKGYGIAYTLQLWPTNDQWPPEIDILEDNGKNRTMTSATLHYGASDTHVHKEITGNWLGWHTAEVEWTAGKLVYSIDGKQWATMSGSYVPSTPMSIAMQTQPWPCGGTWEGCPNATTPAHVNMYVDWVVAYQKA